MSDAEGGTSRHLTAEEIGRTVDHTLSAAERREVEAHLKDCAECRREVAEVQRLVRTRRRRRTMAVIAPAAAAILVAVALVTVDNPLSRSVGAPEPVRSGTESTLDVEVVQPADEALIEGDSVLLAWRPVPAATRYELRVTDAEGSVLVQESLPDTAVVVSVSRGLVDGGLHFWYVDALLEDGRAVSTGTHRFRLAP